MGSAYDAVVVGAGPNGLAAAVALARAGLSTLVIEAKATPGGGARTQELMLPGFHHDVCSAVHPLGIGSPWFRALDLPRFGVEWVSSPAVLAHVVDEGLAVTLERSVAATAAQLGADGPAYRSLLEPFVGRFDELMAMVLGPLRFPSAPVLLARFGLTAMSSMAALAYRHFQGRAAPALLGGIAAHAMLPLHTLATSAFALVLASAGHRVGWPIARGGSQSIIAALLRCFAGLGGEIVVDRPIGRMTDLPRARAYLFDLTPRQLLAVAGDVLPDGYRRRLRAFRYGVGVFKMDWALRGPIPWRHAACMRAATVHLAGTVANIAQAERMVHQGRTGSSPFVLVVQPSRFDDSRAPAGAHTAWAYCHVPAGSRADMSQAIEAQIERHAPGFRDLILARAARDAVAMEAYDPNYVGGDINGGASDIGQLFFRPVMRWDPYTTPARNVFICSSSTPPGGGVHGMCGYWAAHSALRRRFGITLAPLLG